VVRVKVLQVKKPSRFPRTAKEIQIKIIEDGALGVVCIGGNTIIFQADNGVLTAATRSCGVKKTGVFIPFEGQTKMEVLAPEGKFLCMDVLQPLDGTTPESSFRAVQRALLLKQIKSSDQDFCVVFPNINW